MYQLREAKTVVEVENNELKRRERDKSSSSMMAQYPIQGSSRVNFKNLYKFSNRKLKSLHLSLCSIFFTCIFLATSFLIQSKYNETQLWQKFQDPIALLPIIYSIS